MTWYVWDTQVLNMFNSQSKSSGCYGTNYWQVRPYEGFHVYLVSRFEMFTPSYAWQHCNISTWFEMLPLPLQCLYSWIHHPFNVFLNSCEVDTHSCNALDFSIMFWCNILFQTLPTWSEIWYPDTNPEAWFSQVQSVSNRPPWLLYYYSFMSSMYKIITGLLFCNGIYIQQVFYLFLSYFLKYFLLEPTDH